MKIYAVVDKDFNDIGLVIGEDLDDAFTNAQFISKPFVTVRKLFPMEVELLLLKHIQENGMHGIEF